MTGQVVPVTQDGQDAGRGRSTGFGIGRAAAMIAALTVLARVLGLVRTVVFAKTVGATCLGTAYITANTLPNIVYDIVLGGALTSIMVPVLARPANRSDRDPAALPMPNPVDLPRPASWSSCLTGTTWPVTSSAPVAGIRVAGSPAVDRRPDRRLRFAAVRRAPAARQASAGGRAYPASAAGQCARSPG